MEASAAFTVKDLTDIISNIIETIAIIVGGTWTYILFIKNREKYPKADIIQNVTHVRLDKSHILIRVDLKLVNTGKVLLSGLDTENRIQQILPLPRTVKKAVERGKDPVEKGESEVLWPMIGERQVTLEKELAEIEPGEDESIQFDYVVGSGVKVVQVYTYVRNIFKSKKEIGWGVTSLYDIRKGKTLSGGQHNGTTKKES